MTQKQRQLDITSSCLCYGRAKGLMPFMLLVAGVGLEPHDLRVMSPTSYQLLYPAL